MEVKKVIEIPKAVYIGYIPTKIVNSILENAIQNNIEAMLNDVGFLNRVSIACRDRKTLEQIQTILGLMIEII